MGIWAELDVNCTICECVRSPDRLNRLFFLFFFFSSHLETSCFLNWMNFKVMVAHLRSENWGFPHSLPRFWALPNLHLRANVLDDLSSLYLGGRKKPHPPGLDFLRAHHSGTYYPLCEVSRSFAFPPAPSCWVLVILLLIRTSTSRYGGAKRTGKAWLSFASR